jgi:hypothetical protein
MSHAAMAPSAPSDSRRRTLLFAAVASFAALVIAYFWLVDAYGVNTIRVDQWSDLGLIEQAYSGHLTLSALWAQHTDNRIFFPNLVVLLLAKTTHFNIVDEEFLSAVTLVVATSVLIIGHRRRSPHTPWIFYLPVAIVLLSFVQNGNTLWGFQFAWYLVLLTLSVALVLCNATRWSWLVIAGAIAAAVVGSYSSLQGLLIWPAGLVILLLRRRPMRYVLAWVAAGAVIMVIYFVNYNARYGGTADGYVLHHPVQGSRFFFFSVGNVIGAQGGNLPVVLGVLIFLTALWLTFSAVFVLRGSGGSALGVGLICFGLLFAAIITDGRAAAGLDAGGASRYTTFDLLTLVGCYLILLSRRSAGAREPRPQKFLWYISMVTVGVAVCLTLVLGTINGLDGASSWQNSEMQASRVIVNIRQAPDSMLERILIVNPFLVPHTRHLVAFARRNQLALFANASTVHRYARAGLPYDPRSLMVAITNPKGGATEKGAVVLFASAQSDFGITSVVFDIGSSGPVPVRVRAINTPYGWLATWASTRLPDGTYRIEAVASDGADHHVQSAPVVVSVAN